MNFYFLDMSPKAKSNSSKGPTQAPTQKVEVESEKNTRQQGPFLGPYSREDPTFPLHSSHGWLGRPLLFCCSRFPPACLAFARTARAPPPPESSAASEIATGGHLPLPLPWIYLPKNATITQKSKDLKYGLLLELP